MKFKSVSEKINELLKPGLSSENDSDESENELPRVVDFEQDEYEMPDARSTDFRKKNVKLLSDQSARYKGKITSRKELQGESDSSDEISADEIDNNEEEDSEENDVDMASNDDGEGSESSNDDEDIDDESEESENSDEEEGETDAMTSVIAEKNRQAEIQKGMCVQNQLRIWERLLELRIHTQKVLNKSNQLPTPNVSHQTDSDSIAAKEATEKTCLLLKSLFDLKSALTTQFSELRSHLKRPLNENVLSNYENGEPPLKRIATELENQHNQMRSYRNNVLLKWDDRTKLLTPGAGAKKKLHDDFDVIRKIENALLNKDTLIAKSRIIQNAQNNEASESDKEEVEDRTSSNSNIYDDSDFYHQQLRELIEYKTNSSSNLAEVTKQMVELQKIRQKMKKKVDTRASKGRKIRYVVHNKLVNFMAPDDSSSTNWTDQSKDELYKSLFAS